MRAQRLHRPGTLVKYALANGQNMAATLLNAVIMQDAHSIPLRRSHVGPLQRVIQESLFNSFHELV